MTKKIFDNLLVQLPHSLRLRVKAAAALRDQTLAMFVITALENELRRGVEFP